MRFSYFLIGLLVGLLRATNAANEVMACNDKEYDKQFLAATLTGYSEGWTRGRDWAEYMIGWRLHTCLDEANRKGLNGKKGKGH